MLRFLFFKAQKYYLDYEKKPDLGRLFFRPVKDLSVLWKLFVRPLRTERENKKEKKMRIMKPDA